MNDAHSILLVVIVLTAFVAGVIAGVLGALERTDERQNWIDEQVRALAGCHDGAVSGADGPDH